jgi:hypothetical protein
MTERYLGQDTLAPTGYLQPRRYEVFCECLLCGETYSWITEKPRGKNELCPNPICVEVRREAAVAKAKKNFAKIVKEQKAPSRIGGNVMVAAVDRTAEIVMQDHKMTDLRDNIREGDIVAPKLRPDLQRQADGMFNGQGLAHAVGAGPGGTGRSMARRMEMMAKRALAGSYRASAASPAAIHERPAGEAPMRYIGKEVLREKGEPTAGRDIGGGV